jgi:hypothetical protein
MKWHIEKIEFNVKCVQEGTNINTAIVTAERHGYKVNDSDSAIVYVGEKPESDLNCQGSLNWNKAKPGNTVTGSFIVENIGETSSTLNWEITEWPDWGDWTFTPEEGSGLLPSSEPVNVEVSVVVPDDQNAEFSGEIKIVNKNSPGDYCSISVFLSTVKNKISTRVLFLTLFEHHTCLFPLLRQLLELN